MSKNLIRFMVAILIFVFFAICMGSSRDNNTVPVGRNIICFGDSLTAGYGAKRNMSYPAQLSRMTKKRIINAGRIGDTTASALKRLQKDVLGRSPGIVLITLGGNDFKNNVPSEIAFKNLKCIVTQIQKHGAIVIIGGISFPGIDRGYGDAYVRLAVETKAILMPNILRGLLTNRRLMYDPIHPNSKGYHLIAKRFYKAIRPFI